MRDETYWRERKAAMLEPMPPDRPDRYTEVRWILFGFGVGIFIALVLIVLVFEGTR